MRIGEILRWLDGLAPFSSAMDYDNVGLLVGSPTDEVQTALLALDITPAVVEEAHQLGAQLVVSHHPVIFDPLRCLTRGSAPYLLAQYGIDAICAHTNLDMAPGGVNTVLGQALALQNLRPLVRHADSGAEAWMGELRVPLQPRAFALHVKRQLSCDCLRYTDGQQAVRLVGICSGAGAAYLPDAARAGCQAFVTGESPHHLLLLAVEWGLTLVEAGHFETENPVVGVLCGKLAAQFPALRCVCSKAGSNPVQYL